jgi:hypothetical protein
MSDARWGDPREYGERDRDDGRPRVYDERDRSDHDPRDSLMHDLVSLPRSRSGRVFTEFVGLMRGWRWDRSATGGLTPTEHRHRCGPD